MVVRDLLQTDEGQGSLNIWTAHFPVPTKCGEIADREMFLLSDILSLFDGGSFTKSPASPLLNLGGQNPH